MGMRFNLYFTHWSLFCITIISSCFLFFVVATENAKYVAATAAAQSAAGATFDEAAAAANPPLNGANSDAFDATSLNSENPHEKILPNHKKVKKIVPPSVADEPSLANTGNIRDSNATPFVEELSSSPSFSPTASLSDKNIAHDSEHIDSDVDQSTDAENSLAGSRIVSNEVVINDPVTDKPIASGNEGDIEADKTLHEKVVNDFVLEQPAASLSSENNENNIKQPASKQMESSGDILPDITEIPTITTVHEFTDLPLEVMEPTLNSIDSQLTQGSSESARMNRTLELLIGNSDEVLKDDEIIKINDSGGVGVLEAAVAPAVSTEIPIKTTENIPLENVTDENLTESNPNTTTQEEQAQQLPTAAQPTEEVPIPVFSEWAQKQMEAAEKQQQLEQDVVNTSTQKKNNNTNGNGKLPPLKLRAKNYASPDCGAKIIASNSDATNTGALLSSSKDEYMLSPCTNRIWFVVELCEAIQAQKIDLANFELFSSSPRNFTVAVSNRFPTREWSNVGRFIAEDKRTVQSFDLHPHLFGKFVRVDIHSHYSKEHFCPLSLFRVFGTSEFEAFETENHPNEDLDDFDEEFGLEQAHVKNSENNLFKSASDAVLSIVKKAAEVLAKPSSNTNASLMPDAVNECQTPAFGQFSCAECNNGLVERVNTVISCKYKHLHSLLSISRLRSDLLNTQTCANNYGIETNANVFEGCGTSPRHTASQKSYYLNLLPVEYVGALCQLITERPLNASPPHQEKQNSEDAELALNLTIDKKPSTGVFKIIENVKGNKKTILKSEEDFTLPQEVGIETNTQPKAQQATTEPSQQQDEQLDRPPKHEAPISTTTSTESPVIDKEATQDVNIFNVNTDDSQPQIPEQIETDENRSSQSVYEGSGDHLNAAPPGTTTEVPSTMARSNEERPATSTEDPSSWDSIDHLLTSTTVAPGAGVVSGGNSQSGGAAMGNGINMQQKIPNGPHSESIFIRLSNRIKALERNMSLSGQYLEELSRRYKKQVEDLQQTLTQQTLNVRTLEEQSRRHNEYEQLLSQRNLQLKDELDDLTLQVHACIIVIIFVGAFVFLVVMVGILFIRSMRRETKELVALHMDGVKRKTTPTTSACVVNQRKLNRRKSFEDFSDHQQPFNKTTEEKQRRPSEEAMLILKECGGDSKRADLEISEIVGDTRQEPQVPRQRKMSVCYGNNNNNNSCSSINGNSTKMSNNKRKGEKTSWPNSEKSQQQARQHLEELNGTEDYDTFSESDLLARQSSKSKVNPLSNGRPTNESNGQRSKPSKKKLQNIKRQMSVPIVGNNHTPLVPLPSAAYGKPFEDPDNSAIINTSSDYDESLMLDEDDLNNFLPCSDLAYNEFMPEGPSGYQITTNTNDSNPKVEKSKKSRRLSSPAFFKSPFGKSLKSKSPPASSATPPHESTSWEWYRLKKSDPHKHTTTTTNNSLRPSASSGFNQRSSPAVSLDSSSLSEINFPTNSNENSFRILEEAILSSTGAVAVTNGNGNSSSSGGSSSIRSTSTTSSKKKKNRSFRIFRKVF